MTRWAIATFAAFVLIVNSAYAHVGSPDVYAEGQAGEYRLSVTVRPPVVIPGVADIEVRAESQGIDRITITPVPLIGEASKHPPVPEMMKRPSADPQFFTGNLWIMRPGSWQIRFTVDGKQGSGALSIPVTAAATATRKMQPALGAFLAALGLLLILGMVGIAGAAAREATVSPGYPIPAGNKRHGSVAMVATAATFTIIVVMGNRWWRAEARDFAGNLYKPLQMTPILTQGNLLDLKLRDPGWLPQRQLDDFIPDHDHLMHLYLIRWPQMDVVYHLHPQPVNGGEFQLALPSMPAGNYHLYADVVHGSGFPETLVAAIDLPPVSGRPLAGDDARGTAPPIESSTAGVTPFEERFQFGDGYAMVWELPDELVAKTPENFRFRLLDPEGKAPDDMTLYMGMLGHAAFVKTDGTVFAHIHPTGTVPMAAFMMANPQASMGPGMDMANMPGMKMNTGSLPNTVSFPYGFPTGGRFRIFVQMKHGSTVETGVFDAAVQAAAR